MASEANALSTELRGLVGLWPTTLSLTLTIEIRLTSIRITVG
jgi:hypothetical protein